MPRCQSRPHQHPPVTQHRRLSVARWLPLLAAAGLLASGAAAQASLLLALDTPALVRRAKQIAVVEVLSASSAWDERHERIVSTFELAVVESWKGALAPAMRTRVVQPGGTVGDVTMVVSGMSRFSPGERAVVFLDGRPGASNVVGMAQGKRSLRRDPVSERWMVQPPELSGAALVRTGAPRSELPARALPPRPLDDLRAEVRALMTAGGR